VAFRSARCPDGSEHGFTALELITVLAILAVVFTIVTSLFVSFNQQTTNTKDSVVGNPGGDPGPANADPVLARAQASCSPSMPAPGAGRPVRERARRNNVRRLQYEHL